MPDLQIKQIGLMPSQKQSRTTKEYAGIGRQCCQPPDKGFRSKQIGDIGGSREDEYDIHRHNHTTRKQIGLILIRDLINRRFKQRPDRSQRYHQHKTIQPRHRIACDFRIEQRGLHRATNHTQTGGNQCAGTTPDHTFHAQNLIEEGILRIAIRTKHGHCGNAQHRTEIKAKP